MSSQQSAKRIESSKKRRLPRWLKITLLCLLSFVLVWAGWSTSLFFAIRSELNAIRNAGEPMTFAELEASYSIPAGEANAADVLEKA